MSCRVVVECLRATEPVTSPLTAPEPRLSGRLIHAEAQATPLLEPRVLPEHSLLSLWPLTCFSMVMGLAPGHLSFLPPRQAPLGVFNEVSHLPSLRKKSRPGALTFNIQPQPSVKGH